MHNREAAHRCTRTAIISIISFFFIFFFFLASFVASAHAHVHLPRMWGFVIRCPSCGLFLFFCFFFDELCKDYVEDGTGMARF